jgi:hypothetical protein
LPPGSAVGPTLGFIGFNRVDNAFELGLLLRSLGTSLEDVGTACIASASAVHEALAALEPLRGGVQRSASEKV